MKDIEGRQNCTSHHTRYSQVYRHIDYYLEKSLDMGKGYSIDELRKTLFDETEIRFTRMTMKNLIKKYQNSFGITPLEQVYRLNEKYYEVRRDHVRPSRPYKKAGKN